MKVNIQSAPVPELCKDFIRKINKATKTGGQIDPRQWFKTLQKRGVAIPPDMHLLDGTTMISVFEKIAKEYEING